jgi:Zn-dependent protease
LNGVDPEQIFAIVFVMFFAIGLHEFAHAKFADMAGDDTPRLQGRVSLKLWRHFEPIGTVMMIITSITGYGIGWGRPVMVNPTRMRNPRWDHFMSVLAGPMSNLVQAVVYGMAFQFAKATHASLPQVGYDIILLGIIMNLRLCFFNLIPLGPLDGHWLLGAFLHGRDQSKYYMFQRQYGTLALIAIVMLGQVGNVNILQSIIGPPVSYFFKLITGSDL